MQVITTHINADFDSLASMTAAKKLYPEAYLVFPGSLENNLRLFLKNPEFHIHFKKIRDIALDKIELLVIVDTKLADRIGNLASILNNPKLQIHLYDHHPRQAEDIHGKIEIIKPYGSTATIFAEIFQQKAIRLSPKEATLMALGIYENTGFLTFPSTTPQDLHAVAYLLSQGANLNIISDTINKNLTTEQISLLNILLKSLEKISISGQEIIIASASVEDYIADVAILAHKIRDIENINVLFVLIQMKDRIQMVARSRIPEVNVGEITHSFSGGGHHHAASATIRGKPLDQLKKALIDQLHNQITPVVTAKDIMSAPIKSISMIVTIFNGKIIFNKYNVNTMPVLDQKDNLAGLITRRIIDKAIRHGMGKSLIKDFMQSDLITIDENTGIDKIREFMIESNQRFLPVMQKKQLIGAITKTDLLRALHDHMQRFVHESPEESEIHGKNVFRLLKERLPEDILSTLQLSGKIADEMGVSVYAIGGFVRDLLLRVDNLDIDLVVEGNGILFAEYFAKIAKARLKAHRRFGTAKVIFPDGFKIDIATARTEYYEKPLALPLVELSSLKHDLHRRDFTINTLAIQLNKKKFGYLIDFFGGRRDLKEKKIRVLHSLSFIEDPTRVFRAIRFEQRYGFKIGKNTLFLLNNIINMDLLSKLQDYRLFLELYLILKEENPIQAINRMKKLNLLKLIHPNIQNNEKLIENLREIKKVIDWYHLLYLEGPIKNWFIYFIGLTDQLNEKEYSELCQRFKINQKYRSELLQIKIKHSLILKKLSSLHNLKPSNLYNILHPFITETLLYSMAKSPQDEIKKIISHYLTTIKGTKILLTGEDLKSMGYAPSPYYKKILRELLEAKLDGKIKTKEEEKDYVKKYLEKNEIIHKI